mgnify:CR=1 FL=1
MVVVQVVQVVLSRQALHLTASEVRFEGMRKAPPRLGQRRAREKTRNSAALDLYSLAMPSLTFSLPSID